MKRHTIVSLKHRVVSHDEAGCDTFYRIRSLQEKERRRHSRTLVAIAVAIASGLSQMEAQNSDNDYCWVREGRVSVIGTEETRLYESKLFATKDDVARYVFLTNANYDGDRSVAIYRALGKAGSLPGNYWVTSTEVPTSLSAAIPTAVEKARINPRTVKVHRADAPFPASAAKTIHELWVIMLERTRVDEKAVPCAPTAVISAVTERGGRLKAVTVSLEEDSPCLALMRLGRSLINYPQLPVKRRGEAARKIEHDARLLLGRLNKS
jgi:hypothetical protein